MLLRYAMLSSNVNDVNAYIDNLTDTQSKELSVIISRYENYSERDQLELIFLLLLQNDNNNKHLLYLLSILDTEYGTKLLFILRDLMPNDIMSIVSLVYEYDVKYSQENNIYEKLNRFISLLHTIKESGKNYNGKKCNGTIKNLYSIPPSRYIPAMTPKISVTRGGIRRYKTRRQRK
jgi:hypothetical protein